jgi:SAM-dependent methyltransferase
MWDERYAEPGYAYGSEPNDFVRQMADGLGGEGRALCLAEGQGRNAVFLAELGWDVTAVDESPVGLQKAGELARQRGVAIHTITADLGNYAIEPLSWDLVVLVFAHLPPSLRRRVHAAVVQGLRPGGFVILEAYTPDQIGRGTGGPPDEAMMMTAGRLRQEFDGLELLRLEEKVREVVEGKYHTGEGAVVQMLARKPG